MNYTKTHLLVLMLLFLLHACKGEELVEPQKGSPVFYFEAIIDGEVVELKAGENNYIAGSSLIDQIDRYWAARLYNKSADPDLDQFNIVISNHLNPPIDNPDQDLEKTIVSGNYPYAIDPGPTSSEVFLSFRYKQHIYESSLIDQKPDAYFEIKSVKDTLADGVLYKIAEMEFRGRLFSPLGLDTLDVKQGNARLAFANPD